MRLTMNLRIPAIRLGHDSRVARYSAERELLTACDSGALARLEACDTLVEQVLEGIADADEPIVAVVAIAVG